MKISATSALVLNWTAADVWLSPQAAAYTKALDLSEGSGLLSVFDDEERYMHLNAVSNRKHFVRAEAIKFIEEHSDTDEPQVLVLAAGIAPLSIDIAALYPRAKVFDVDKYLMEDKERFLNNALRNISFITADITDTISLSKELQAAGWKPKSPTIAILEGITYYLPENDLKHLLQFLAEHSCTVAGDFGVLPQLVDEHNRHIGLQLFQKIKATIGLENTYNYDPKYFIDLLTEAGFTDEKRVLLSTIQQNFRGQIKPFEGEEPCWISMFSAKPAIG